MRLHEAQLVEQPRPTGADLVALGLVVEAPLAGLVRLPLEVLHGVRDVDVVARDASARQRALEQPARGADERVAAPIFLVTRLLAHEHQRRVRRPFAEHGLRAALPQLAAPAIAGVGRKISQTARATTFGT